MDKNPDGIRPVTIDEMSHMGVDQDGRLYWKGRPVITEQRVRLAVWMNAAAIAAALAAVVQAACSVATLFR